MNIHHQLAFDGNHVVREYFKRLDKLNYQDLIAEQQLLEKRFDIIMGRYSFHEIASVNELALRQLFAAMGYDRHASLYEYIKKHFANLLISSDPEVPIEVYNSLIVRMDNHEILDEMERCILRQHEAEASFDAEPSENGKTLKKRRAEQREVVAREIYNRLMAAHVRTHPNSDLHF